MRRTSITGSVTAATLGLVLLLAGCGGTEPRWAGAAGGSPAADRPSASAAATSGGASPSATPGTGACGPWGCEQQRHFEAAAALVKTKPGYLGLVVSDRQTGAVWRTGTPEHVMWTSS